MEVKTERFTEQNHIALTAFLKNANSMVLRKLMLLGFVVIFIFFVLIFKGGKNFSITFFIYSTILPAVVGAIIVYFYYAPHKIKKDIENGVKKTGVLKVQSVERLKDMIIFDHIVTFEKNPHIKKHLVAQALNPDMLTATTFSFEVTPISKLVLKIEPIA